MHDEEIYQIVYVSRAADHLSYSSLHSILDESRAWNAEHDVTGVLIFSEDHFVQLLEGPEEHVRELITRIGGDPRNHDMEIVYEGPGVHRMFPAWSMAFQDAATARDKQPLIDELLTLTHTRPQPRVLVPLQILARSFRAESLQ